VAPRPIRSGGQIIIEEGGSNSATGRLRRAPGCVELGGGRLQLVALAHHDGDHIEGAITPAVRAIEFQPPSSLRIDFRAVAVQ
jgi:hypothetical protein